MAGGSDKEGQDGCPPGRGEELGTDSFIQIEPPGGHQGQETFEMRALALGARPGLQIPT